MTSGTMRIPLRLGMSLGAGLVTPLRLRPDSELMELSVVILSFERSWWQRLQNCSQQKGVGTSSWTCRGWWGCIVHLLLDVTIHLGGNIWLVRHLNMESLNPFVGTVVVFTLLTQVLIGCTDTLWLTLSPTVFFMISRIPFSLVN